MQKSILYIAVLFAVVAAAGCCPKTKTETSEKNIVVETIMARRSVRHYTDTPVGRDTLTLLAKCGINAPNARNMQEWAVRIVDSKEFLDGATAVMKTSTPEDPSGMLSVNAGALCENICLAAQSMGLGSVIMGGPVMFLNNTPEAKPFLDRLALPEGYKVRICVGVGHPDEAPEAKPRDESKVRFID